MLLQRWYCKYPGLLVSGARVSTSMHTNTCQRDQKRSKKQRQPRYLRETLGYIVRLGLKQINNTSIRQATATGGHRGAGSETALAKPGLVLTHQ